MLIALILIVLFSLLPLTGWRFWIFKFPEYFSIQWAFVFLVSLIIFVSFRFPYDEKELAVIFLLFLAFAYHLRLILPFTRFGMKTVPDHMPGENSLKILSCNVLQSNKNYEKLVEQVKDYQPDILVALETNQAWIDHLNKYLEGDFPYCKEVQRENTYGMVVYSQWPIINEDLYQLYNETPYVQAQLEMPDEEILQLFVMHPKPPSPTEAKTSLPKDAEMSLVAKEISQFKDSQRVVVVGDFNDVAWSKTTKQFLFLSGLKNPMAGRKLLITFPTYLTYFGFPLDQAFVSKHFSVRKMKKLTNMGSDHYPVYYEFGISAKTK